MYVHAKDIRLSGLLTIVTIFCCCLCLVAAHWQHSAVTIACVCFHSMGTHKTLHYDNSEWLRKKCDL